MKVKVAAAQLSSSIASAIETYACFTNVLPSEALFTAEFAQLMDNIFDSLNGSSLTPLDTKVYRCALSDTSPHLELWSKFLNDLNLWKLIDLHTGDNVTSQYSFIRGWQITIRSIIFLWNRLKQLPGIHYLNLRGLNQDPIENLFCNIRQHGFQNTNPTCYQFIAALKTVEVHTVSH